MDVVKEDVQKCQNAKVADLRNYIKTLISSFIAFLPDAKCSTNLGLSSHDMCCNSRNSSVSKAPFFFLQTSTI